MTDTTKDLVERLRHGHFDGEILVAWLNEAADAIERLTTQADGDVIERAVGIVLERLEHLFIGANKVIAADIVDELKRAGLLASATPVGAEAMREACAKVCERTALQWGPEAGSSANEAALKIRSLPLPAADRGQVKEGTDA